MRKRTIMKLLWKWPGIAAAVAFIYAGGMAHAITFTYSDIKSSCTSLTISPSGVITCHTGGANAIPFNFQTQLSCSAGLDIDTTSGLVKCATTLPECTSLSVSSAGAAASGLVPVTMLPDGDGNITVTLTAGCNNNPASYQWAAASNSSPSPSPAQNASTATVTIPATSSPGYHEYSVRARNDTGYGSSASVNLKVTVPGQSGPFAYIPGNGKVSLLDTASNKATPSLFDVGAVPLGVAVHPRGARAYVTNQGHHTVSVIDTPTNKVVDTVPVAPAGQSPAGVAVTPDGDKVYVANNKTDNVSVIDALKYTVIGTVPLLAGSGPMGVATAKKADGSQLVFVANSGNDSVSVIDAAQDVTVGGPIGTGRVPYGVAATPDGGKIYVTNSGSDSITVIETGTYQATGHALGANAAKPLGIAVSPDGKEAYVVNQNSGTVSVIDTATDTVSATITGLGPMPYGVDFSGDGSLAYVTNSGTGSNGSVSVIDTARRTVVETVSLGGAPYALGQFVGSASPYLGLWWGGESESGWGMSITQHGSMIFVALFTYDQSAQPVWYVMSSCPIVTPGRCTGDIYKVTGGTAPGAAWAPNLATTKAGTGTLTFSDVNNGVFSFTLNGVSGSKTIERQTFSSGTPPQAVDYTDLWWNAAESGWGISLTQDMGMIFAAWYTYDAANQPVWYVASSCPLIGSGCTGEVYKVTGGSMPTAGWAPNLAVNKVGSVTFAFGGSSTGEMTYTPDNGEPVKKTIMRQPF